MLGIEFLEERLYLSGGNGGDVEPGYTPARAVQVVGDWDGDGDDDAGAALSLKNKTFYWLDLNDDGVRTRSERYSVAMRTKIVCGDANDDGFDDIGWFRNGSFRFDTNGDYQLKANDGIIKYGKRYNIGVAADINDDGKLDLAVRRRGVAGWRVDYYEKNTDVDAFASALGDAGAKFYGAWWCGHCEEQKAMFNESAELPYIECADEDGNQTQECSSAGISSYPTWERTNGDRVTGVQSFEELASFNGIEVVYEAVHDAVIDEVVRRL